MLIFIASGCSHVERMHDYESWRNLKKHHITITEERHAHHYHVSEHTFTIHPGQTSLDTISIWEPDETRATYGFIHVETEEIYWELPKGNRKGNQPITVSHMNPGDYYLLMKTELGNEIAAGQEEIIVTHFQWRLLRFNSWKAIIPRLS